MAKGLWKNHYASTNANEYWAEGAQTWFWSNYEYMDGEIRVQTPEDLQRYDPKLYELLSRVTRIITSLWMSITARTYPARRRGAITRFPQE